MTQFNVMNRDELVTYLQKRYGFDMAVDLPEPKRGKDPVGEVDSNGEVHLAPSADLFTLLHEIGHVIDRPWKDAQTRKIHLTQIPAWVLLAVQLYLVFTDPIMIILTQTAWIAYVLFWRFRILKPLGREKEARCDRFASTEYRRLVDEGLIPPRTCFWFNDRRGQ